MSLVLDQGRAGVGNRRRPGIDPGFYSLTASPVLQTGVSTELPCFVPRSGVEVASSEGSPWLHELERMCKLTDDWDSAGASAPSPEIIADARQWLDRMLDKNATLPDSIAPGVNGEIIFYWQRPGVFVEATIDRPGHVEWMERRNDRIRHFESDTNFFVVIDD